MLVSSFNLLQSFNYAPYLFRKKRFKSEINCFCIQTLVSEKKVKGQCRCRIWMHLRLQLTEFASADIILNFRRLVPKVAVS